MGFLRYHGTVLVVIALAGAAGFAPARARAAEGEPAQPRPGADVVIAPSWDGGFLVHSSDGAFRVRAGGLAQADGRYFPGNTAPGPVDQFSIRCARLELDGTVWRS